jgi:uncharacterized membrane-anchored protein
MTSPSPLDPSVPELQPLPEQTQVAQKLPRWRFWVPLLFQSALILAIPAHSAYTYATGKTVVLQTLPVDPYDLLRGYSQTLSYQISDSATLSKLPGGDQIHSGSFYVVLEAPPANNASPPASWQPVRVSRDRPTNLPANQVALKGNWDAWRSTYGLETYYMPEDQREQVNQAIRQAQSQSPQAFVVEAKVDAGGNAVPVSLWVRDRNYRF